MRTKYFSVNRPQGRFNVRVWRLFFDVSKDSGDGLTTYAGKVVISYRKRTLSIHVGARLSIMFALLDSLPEWTSQEKGPDRRP